jgi:hypothetical protein
MIFTQPLSFIFEFVEELDRGIRECAPNRKLSTGQRYWLRFCLMGILLSNQVCWAAFERVGLGGYRQAALSWMFRPSKLLWPLLLHVSILLILKNAPPKPETNAAYPSKLDLLRELLREFQGYHPGFQVKAILADALYGSAAWMNQAASLFPKTPVISQLKKTQKVRCRQREMTVAPYFATHPGVKMTLRIRGGQTVKVVLGSARLYVSAPQQKRFVVALQYPGEQEYRYRVASDLSWRAVDIASAYTLRWLVEQLHREGKPVTGLERCQCRQARIQRHHIGCALLVWVRLKELAVQTGRTVYQLKQGLLDDYLIQQLKKPSLKMVLA